MAIPSPLINNIFLVGNKRKNMYAGYDGNENSGSHANGLFPLQHLTTGAIKK